MQQLTFVTPATLEEFRPYRKDVQFLQSFLPFPHWSKQDLDGFLESTVGELTLIYLGGFPVASFSIELYRRSAELHGIVRPDLKQLLCPRSATLVKKRIYELVLSKVFLELKKDVLVAKVPTASLGALGFVRHMGFKQINVDNGETVWKLDQTTYLERLYGKKEDTKGQGSESNVCV